MASFNLLLNASVVSFLLHLDQINFLYFCTTKDFYKLPQWAEAPRAKEFCKKLDNRGGLPPPVDETELHQFFECGLGCKIHLFVDCRPWVKQPLSKADFEHVGMNPNQLSHLLSLPNAQSRLVEVARRYREMAQDPATPATTVNMALYCKRGEQRSVAFGVLLQRLVREAFMVPASLQHLHQPLWGGCQGKCEACADGLALTVKQNANVWAELVSQVRGLA